MQKKLVKWNISEQLFVGRVYSSLQLQAISCVLSRHVYSYLRCIGAEISGASPSRGIVFYVAFMVNTYS